MSEDTSLKRKLIEATDSVRKKFNAIKNIQKNEYSSLEKMYGPVLEPINLLSKSIKAEMTDRKQQPNFQQIKSTIKQDPSEFTGAETKFSNVSLPESYVYDLHANPTKYDTVYGVRIATGIDKYNLYLGHSEISFASGNIILRKNNKNIGVFEGNDDLYNLLFLKDPPQLKYMEDISLENLKRYTQMLKLTSAAHLDYNPKKALRSTRSEKFINLIKPLLTKSEGRRPPQCKKAADRRAKAEDVARTEQQQEAAAAAIATAAATATATAAATAAADTAAAAETAAATAAAATAAAATAATAALATRV
ncbi:unnamed protein product [Ceutorhynchus assimilis]|uniref:DUF8207 domain-containing protein n=1 Tax=Ceutorhynchus assimilis TaxID=467358 RepID=A0A9N9QBJ6_9CUCU|nr:unnamed protein product [Ceutorhynchus assimilis]